MFQIQRPRQLGLKGEEQLNLHGAANLHQKPTLHLLFIQQVYYIRGPWMNPVGIVGWPLMGTGTE